MLEFDTQTWLALVAIGSLTLIVGWSGASLVAQRRARMLEESLRLVRGDLEQAREVASRQEQHFRQLAADKASLDVELGRLGAERQGLLLRLQRQEQASQVQAEQLEASRAGEQDARVQHQQALARLEAARQSALEYRSLWERGQKELDELRADHQRLKEQHAELSTTLTQKQEHFREQLAELNKSREILKKEFENLANEILERKGKAFSELSQQSLSNLLNPIQAEMKGFKDKVERIHEKDVEQRIKLKTELENLQRLNREITDQAEKLTTALQGQKKTQGNWGELMLENVLDKSGLRLGEDYKREVSFTTAEGRQRPDVLIYLPQGKHLVIDAKTSLAAYTRYVNAEDELTRQQALQAHARAVSDRINELADRNYYRLPGLNSPEIVIMFIPIESAYVEALKHDDTLYQRAIERHVLVATPTTLLTSLNIVRQLWRFEDQSKHTAELAERAGRFYNKLNSFLTSMQDVGKKLDSARTSYDRALGQLYSGRGNLIKQAAEFKELGVSVQRELPEELVERAALELESPVKLP